MPDVHEFITSKFKPEIDFDEQVKAIEAIGERLSRCPGLRRRDSYYAEYAGAWLTHLTWVDEESIEAANDEAEEPEDARLFRRVDTTSVTYERYRQVGSHDGPAADPG